MCEQGKLLVGSMGWSTYSTVDPSITQVYSLIIQYIVVALSSVAEPVRFLPAPAPGISFAGSGSGSESGSGSGSGSGSSSYKK